MKKIELLSPAGNMETLMSAIDNGADAVYIGGELFNARAFAQNFDNKQIKDAAHYCHLYGVKLYVAVNTIIFENEIEECLNYLKYLYEINVDAVIMQDLGMISLAKKLIPDLEIHSSTQINCHNKECLKFLKSIGVKRAVLAREMSLDEINNLNEEIDIEVFIHGALCVCYSGRCLFSSLNGGRSGNRGKCVGSCRLPYDIIKNGKKLNIKYPLSTKELNSVYNIEKILKSNISSLKIEGRMKSPEYVGYVTKVYRRLIDDFYKGKKPIVKEEEINNLSKLYNRKFTSGYLFEDDIYNTETSNHIGSHLGKIIKINKQKIYIKLDDDLYMEDGIRFLKANKGMIVNKIYDKNGYLVNHINKGNIAIVDNKIGLNSEDLVNKTIDKKLLEDIKKTPKKKIPINFEITAKINEKLVLTISDGINKISKSSILLEEAKKIATTEDVITEKLNKLGNTPFELKEISFNLENVFIPLKNLNALRHDLINLLIEKRTSSDKKINFKYQKKKVENKTYNLNFLVRNEKQLLAIKDKANIIYTDDFNLYQKYKNPNIYYRLPNIMTDFQNYKNENLLINDLGSLNKYYKNNNIITDYSLNISNSESVNFLKKYNVKLVTLSPEIPDYDILKFTNNTEIIIYGKLELMIIKKFHLTGKDLYLKDKFGNKFKILNNDYTSIMSSKNIDLLNENVKTNKRIMLLDENINDIKNIIKK